MKNYSLSIKLFISLTLLLVVPVVIINAISNYAVMSTSENEISKNSIGKLKVAENTVLQLKGAINKDAIRVTVNSAVNDLEGIQYNNPSLHDTDNLFKISRVIDIIADIVKTNSEYYSVYLYLEDLGYTFTSNFGFISEKSLSDTGWMKYYRDFKENKASLSWLETRGPGSGNNGAGISDYVITYIYPLTPYTTSINGALVINVREEVLSKLINGNNLNSEGYIFIMNDKGDIISHVDRNFLCKNISGTGYVDTIINTAKKEGYLVTGIDGSRSLVSYYKSDNNNWIYVGVFSLDTLITKASAIRMYTIYISLLIGVAGIIIAYLISRRLYSPLQKLIQDIKATKGIDFLENEDEMSVLSKAFNTLKKHEESLFDVLEKNRRNIRESHLNNLLKGNYPYETDPGILGVDFQLPYYICAIISIDKYGEFIKAYGTDQQYYIKMLILKVAEEILNASFVCTGINRDKGEIVLILNVGHPAGMEQQTQLEDCFLNIQEEMTKIFDYTISIGIGYCHQGEAEIQASYLEAQEALKFRLIKGYGSISVWQKAFAEHRYYYPFTIEKHLLNYLDVRDKDGIADTVKSLAAEIRSKEGLSCDNVMQIFNQLVGNTIIKYLVDSHVDMNHVFGGSFNIYRELSSKETLEDAVAWLTDVYRRVIQYCSKSAYNEKDKFEKIMEFIRRSYRNDIGIRDVAEHVKLSYSHVRKIFKDETGENIVDYVNAIRINEAKKMLTCADMHIKDIALSLGYNNDQSFTRAFKKLEGITPGEYRSKADTACMLHIP